MKQVCIAVAAAMFFTWLAAPAVAQMPTPQADPGGSFHNSPPHFPHLADYLACHLEYPPLATENCIEGTVEALVVIGQQGEVREVSIVTGLGFGCDEAVIKVLKQMPAWMPRIRNGKPAAASVIVPVRFQMRGF